jgi:hypothetical protein
LRGESEKKQKTAHPTTDNANVTDVEGEAASFMARASASGEYGLPGFFIQSVQALSTKSKSFGKSVVAKLQNRRLAVCAPQIYQRIRFYSTGLKKLL